MDKRVTLAVVLFVVASALGTAGLVWAEGDPPSGTPPAGPSGGCPLAATAGRHGPGMMGRMFGGQGQGRFDGVGCGVGSPMQAAVHAALAEGLGLSGEEFDSRLAAGQTPAQIAQELGLTSEAFYELMQAAHAAAWAGLSGTDEQAPAGWMMMRNRHARQMGQQRGPMMADCPFRTD